jgi:hypothetical protein
VVRRFRAFRPVGWAYLAVLAVMLATRSKPYYLVPSYTALLAAGAVLVEGMAPRPAGSIARAAIVLLVVIGGAVSFPLAKPVLSTEALVRYMAALRIAPSTEERQQLGRLPQHYADMLGWPELAAELSQVYHALPAADRERACIFVGNYGEAGAVDVLGAPLGLPRAISGHNSYFLWGPRGCTGEVLILLGGQRPDIEKSFSSVEQAGLHSCNDCMPYENNLPIWIARGPKVPMAMIWPRVKHYI